MATNSPAKETPLDEYDQNRQRFTDEQLAPYTGQWVAFSKDGSRIVAAGADLLELDRRIVAAGEDPENVWLESLIREDVSLGAM